MLIFGLVQQQARQTARHWLCICWFVAITGTGYAQPLQVIINGKILNGHLWQKNTQTNLASQEISLSIGIYPRNSQTVYEYRFQQYRGAVWLKFRGDLMLTYNGLSGDIYQFELREPGKPPFLRHRFMVENALWQRWWFVPSLFFYGLLLVGLMMYLFYRYRIRQFIRMQQVRDRIARDLHDDMGSYLSSISILSQTAHRNALRDPEKTQKALDSIGQTARQVMESMNDMVWSINPSHDSMDHVLTRMADVATNLFSETDIDFQLQIDNNVGTFPLTAEARRDFFLIYKEALTNAARYAQATRVSAALQRTQGHLVLTIQDNGRGFDQQQPDYQNPGGGNGLRNMHTRAELLGGKLIINSIASEGTTVRLHVGSSTV